MFTKKKRSQKIIALDLGTRWVGIAISDTPRRFAHPHDTVELHRLYKKLETLIISEQPSLIVVGHPITVDATASNQTRSVEAQFASLQKTFPEEQWILWDERFTSLHAQHLMRDLPTKKKDKKKEHAIAAALLLQSYCDAHTPPELYTIDE